VRLHLDTEYHGARRAQRLLSLGLVAEDGRWFYGELPGELARVVDHDDFFATHVTPQFGRVPGAAHGDEAALAQALHAFLAGWTGPLEVACDDRLDAGFLDHLLALPRRCVADAAPARTVDLSVIGITGLVQGTADRAGLIAQGPLARRFGLRAHHALADAESLAVAAAQGRRPLTQRRWPRA
jgi:hypothetical protein